MSKTIRKHRVDLVKGMVPLESLDKYVINRPRSSFEINTKEGLKLDEKNYKKCSSFLDPFDIFNRKILKRLAGKQSRSQSRKEIRELLDE